MNQNDILITFASWEERFTLGFEKNLAIYRPRQVLLYYLDRYTDWTEAAREAAAAACEAGNMQVTQKKLSVDDAAQNWKSIGETIDAIAGQESRVVVDMTTMPRESIWMILWFLDLNAGNVSYVYHRALRHAKDWLSRDPQKPRLVFKMSGTPRLGAKTLLVVLAGFDPERTAQLMGFFEPSVTLLGLQTTNTDPDNDRRMKEHAERFGSEASVEFFKVDAYGKDHGQEAIEAILASRRGTYNVVMSSLGPKPTAITLYRIQRGNREFALAYAPSSEFNREYSSGIGECISGDL
ncbi:MAG TPA: hypothetical protein VMY37_29735 [Thermoguttaceae bacterium]|nr:hypothetical protein [Thermoguttaceae bacterium]